MRKLSLIALLLLSIGSLFCRPVEETKEADIALLLLKTEDNPFFQEIRKGVTDQWNKGQGLPKLYIRAGAKEGDVNTQRRILDEFYNQFTRDRKTPILKGIILTPSGSSNELTGQIKRLKDAGVPIILVDTKISADALRAAGTTYDVFIGSDNMSGGMEAAKIVKEHLPRGGKVLVLNGVDGQETAAARRDGFFQQIASFEKDGVKFGTVERTCNWRRTEARTTVASFLGMGEMFDGMFAANDEMALGALEALRQYPETKRPAVVVGFDAIDEALKAVDEERLTATLAQDPYGMGVRAVGALEQIWKGGMPEKDQVIPVKRVEKKK
jgi:ABC-type sugar transport system substrate-binding protein